MGDNKKNRFKRARNSEFQKKQNIDRTLQFLATEKFREPEVGINEYVSPQIAGFTGIIKARYSDFHVNEINESGEIAKLTDVKPVTDFNTTGACTKNGDEEEVNEIEQFKGLLSEDVLKQIHELLTSAEDTKVIVDAEELDKEKRRTIYDGLRNIFGRAIVANTVMVDDKKVVEIKKFRKDLDVDKRRRWPSDKGEYVHFLVYKEILDTIEVTFKLADCLRMNSTSFTYAGIKDRRAKTTQWFCAHKIDPNELLDKTKPFIKLHVGNFCFKTEPLKLGQLKGNHFKVALRNITADLDLISNSMEALELNGFINYYGLQRFGYDKEVPTFEIGVKLLQGKFKDACDLILKVRTTETPTSEIANAKRIYNETKDCRLACKQFKKLNNKCIESKLLLGFNKNGPTDYVNSLENIPRNMRLMYIHSFQSLVWNKMASLRVKKFGLKPIEGDLVLINKTDKVNDEEDVNNIKILTKDDLNDYTIKDVVLPLPGFDIKYPENELKESYKDLLSNYNLTLDMPKQSVKTYTLSGAYRKLISTVTNFTWKIIQYDHPDDTLIRSDYEELTGIAEPQNNLKGQFKAVVMEFTLPSSSYATMVLREALKTDTSTSEHAKLNKYHSPVTVAQSTSQATEEVNSLLANSEKYEEFKRQVFGLDSKPDENCKRKQEDSDETCNKKVKVDSNGI